MPVEASPVGLTVEFPRSLLSDEALTNLRKIIDSKASLLKKAIGTDCLDIIVTDDKIAFPWFPEPDADAFVTYARHEFSSTLLYDPAHALLTDFFQCAILPAW